LKDIDGIHLIHSGEQILAAVRWNNRDKETSRSPDISAMENDVETYWEVKSTMGHSLEFTMTPNEWNLAKEKGDQFYILRVCGAKTDQPTVYEIHDPYQLSLEGVVKIKGLEPLTLILSVQAKPEKATPSRDTKHTEVVSKFQPVIVEPVKLDIGRSNVSSVSVRLQQSKSCRIALALFLLIISIVLAFWWRMRVRGFEAT